MPAALSITPGKPPGAVQARLGFAGSELRVQGRVASLACAYATHGTTVEISVVTQPDRAGHGYALLAARDFVMVGAGPDLDMQWDATSPTTLRLALRLGSERAKNDAANSRLWVDLPA